MNSNNIFIFLNIYNVYSLEKEDLVKQVKNIIIKYKSKLNMKGFYKVKVHVGEDIGLFIDIYKIDDIEYSNSLDLRISKISYNIDKMILFILKRLTILL